MLNRKILFLACAVGLCMWAMLFEAIGCTMRVKDTPLTTGAKITIQDNLNVERFLEETDSARYREMRTNVKPGGF